MIADFVSQIASNIWYLSNWLIHSFFLNKKLAIKSQPGPAKPPDPGIKRKSEFLEPAIPQKKQKGDFYTVTKVHVHKEV